MSEQLERRLRRDLSTLDDISIGDARPVEVASRTAIARRALHRRLAVAGLSATLVAAGGLGLWAMTTTGTDELVTTDSTTSDTDAEPGPSTTAAEEVAEPSATTTTTTTTTTSTTTSTVAAPSASGTMRPIAADPRGAVLYPSVVWADDVAIVVGGQDPDGNAVLGGATYTPTSDTWAPISEPPDSRESPGRINTLSMWTGSEMLVLGGDLPDGGLLVSYGHAYDPSTDTWRVTAAPPGFVDDRTPWVWTGSELLVWPSTAGDSATDTPPLAYDPTHDSWRELSEPPLSRRQRSASVWTGTEWLVWGGTDDGVEFDDGAAYDPSTDTWRAIAESPLSKRRVRAVWTGNEMIVAAGSTGGDPVTGNGEFAHGDGAAYDPVSDTWRSIAEGPAHPGFDSLWTGRLMLMFAKGRVFTYDPTADRWLDDCCGPLGSALGIAVAGTPVWTGNEALQIGSTDPSIGGVTFTPSTASSSTIEPIEPIEESSDCEWVLEPLAGGGAGGHLGKFFALRNGGVASCATPSLRSVTGLGNDDSTPTARLGSTYLSLTSPPLDVEPGDEVTIVIETSETGGPCGTRLEVDALTIVLSDGTSFEIPLQDPIDVSCEFDADLGVQ